MYVENWTSVTSNDVVAFLKDHNAMDIMHQASPQTTQVTWHKLPFYEEVVLIRLSDPDWPKALNIYYLEARDGEFYRLSGDPTPIHRVNAAAPVIITPDNVLEYLRCFCFFLRGEHGPFLLAEHLHDPYIPQAPDSDTHARMAGIVRPAVYEGMTETGDFLCNGVVYYANCLFAARFAVEPNGMVMMLEVEEMATDLPVRVKAPIT